MKFTKMHGAGNDYVYVNGLVETLPEDLPELSRQMSHRHFGVGADGLILILPAEQADVRMQMFNADGSESEMCGNGIRCLAKYVYERDICRQDALAVQTKCGVLMMDLEVEDGKVQRVKVDMGEPMLEAEKIPTTLSGATIVQEPLEINNQIFEVTCVSMGNPHAVIFVDDANDSLVLGLGPMLETDARFPQRTNVEFVELISETEVRQRTWERGSGETWACGTGASAVCVAGVLANKTQRQIRVHLLGGDLDLHWDEETNHVFMTGGATEVFTGDW
ncbi:MAG: diaminopimelate epimerase [Planctomycetota bacterium]|nr:diaminopimelate epimerase [Planctomycetota bacterium]